MEQYVLHFLPLWLNRQNQELLSDAQWQPQAFTHKHIVTPVHYHVDFISNGTTLAPSEPLRTGANVHPSSLFERYLPGAVTGIGL